MAFGVDAVDMVLSCPGHHYPECGGGHRRRDPERGTPSFGDETDGFLGVGNKKHLYTFGVVNST